MKTLKEINHADGGDRPCCFKERGAKAIWSQTSSRTHGENNFFDLSASEGAIKFIEGERPIRIQSAQLEDPISFTDTTHKIMVERM